MGSTILNLGLKQRIQWFHVPKEQLVNQSIPFELVTPIFGHKKGRFLFNIFFLVYSLCFLNLAVSFIWIHQWFHKVSLSHRRAGWQEQWSAVNLRVIYCPCRYEHLYSGEKNVCALEMEANEAKLPGWNMSDCPAFQREPHPSEQWWMRPRQGEWKPRQSGRVVLAAAAVGGTFTGEPPSSCLGSSAWGMKASRLVIAEVHVSVATNPSLLSSKLKKKKKKSLSSNHSCSVFSVSFNVGIFAVIIFYRQYNFEGFFNSVT